MLAEPASAITDLALAGVAGCLAVWLSRRPDVSPRWVTTFGWTSAAALAGAIHHGFVTSSERWDAPSWAFVTFLVVVAISYLLAVSVDEVLGPGHGRVFWVLRSAGLVAYVVVALTIGASIGAILVCEGATMILVLLLWARAYRAGHPRAAGVLVAILVSTGAGVIRALPPDVVAPSGLDPTSLYHLAQIPGVWLLARAAARTSPHVVPSC